MKKFRYIIAAVLVVAIGTTIFFGCEKENEDIDKNTRLCSIISKLKSGIFAT